MSLSDELNDFLLTVDWPPVNWQEVSRTLWGTILLAAVIFGITRIPFSG